MSSSRQEQEDPLMEGLVLEALKAFKISLNKEGAGELRLEDQQRDWERLEI